MVADIPAGALRCWRGRRWWVKRRLLVFGSARANSASDFCEHLGGNKEFAGRTQRCFLILLFDAA
ncbi:hypothetical protein [Rhizobium sp. CCGE 510]|uniref:hypothetical protein n=1 Tax=Rhizobium sp. CCGE 510 TaxID=1132836 RepID=UPI00027B91D4|nr:hypothetical protein [Rhizobium sp. CCGE 510]EJT05961.1 hypothetical protein RCCGE510_06897 [Rhizobium sp. CCGE 510]